MAHAKRGPNGWSTPRRVLFQPRPCPLRLGVVGRVDRAGVVPDGQSDTGRVLGSGGQGRRRRRRLALPASRLVHPVEVVRGLLP